MSHFKGSAYYDVTENQHDTIMFNQMIAQVQTECCLHI